jgi:arginine N-succinyltransferase
MLHYPQTIVRPVKQQDLSSLMELAKQAGPGMTNLPQDEQALQEKIDVSLQSFVKEYNSNNILGYFFVMEDLATKKIVGTSAICGAGSHMMPFYHFKMSTVNYVNIELNLNKTHRILTMVNDYQGCTEVCSLFLTPQHRQYYNGSLLSRSRFLFMAEHPKRFNKTIIAEMRGVMNEDGSQPFWDGVISNFIDLSFMDADKLTGKGIKQFISDMMPRYPLYVEMLPQSAQDVIDKVHDATKPALALLKNEGFASHGYIDIFEAGSMVECELKKIKSVRKSIKHEVNMISSDFSGINKSNLYLISNARLDFRACIAYLNIDKDTQEVTIMPETAEALGLKINDKIRYVPLMLPSDNHMENT